MKQRVLFAAVLLTATTLSACGDKKEATRAVSFANDVQPLLNAYCLECHKPGGPGLEASGLSLESYDNLMKGTKFGPIITPGSSLSSTLVTLVEGRADKSLKMPHGERKPLAPEAIKLIRDWIDQGANKN